VFKDLNYEPIFMKFLENILKTSNELVPTNHNEIMLPPPRVSLQKLKIISSFQK